MLRRRGVLATPAAETRLERGVVGLSNGWRKTMSRAAPQAVSECSLELLNSTSGLRQTPQQT